MIFIHFFIIHSLVNIFFPPSLSHSYFLDPPTPRRTALRRYSRRRRAAAGQRRGGAGKPRGTVNSAAGRGCEKPARQMYRIIRILPVKLGFPHTGQKRRQCNPAGKTRMILHTSQGALFTHPMKHVCLERPERVRPVKQI